MEELKGGTPRRIRVEKNINKKAVLLKLSFNYFFIFAGVIMLSLSVLLSSFSGKGLFFVILINVASYLILQYLDRTNILEEYTSNKLPKSIENNLYELNDENDPIVKKSTNSKL